MSGIPMRFLAEDENRAEPPQPGEAWWYVNAKGERRLYYACPRNPRGTCGVPILPTKLPNGAGWSWDGNEERPTLSPSVNCVGGCGWHGWVRDGHLVGA